MSELVREDGLHLALGHELEQRRVHDDRGRAAGAHRQSVRVRLGVLAHVESDRRDAGVRRLVADIEDLARLEQQRVQRRELTRRDAHARAERVERECVLRVEKTRNERHDA